jgi:hypothetical protein
MSARVLKIIGIITMTFDHIAVHLMTQEMILYLVFRGIGRFAFPIFALMVALGFRHSRNRMRYLIRLVIFATLIELFLVLLWLSTGLNTTIFPIGSTASENVIWPLVFGLMALMCLKKGTWWSYALYLCLLVGPLFIRFPYGIYGIALILVFGITENKHIWMALGAFLTGLYVLIPRITDPASFQPIAYLQLVAVLALALFYFYNGKRGKGSRWFFYLYYPAHIGILVLLSMFL